MGRNGAGKTTLMKLLVGLLRAKQGRIRLAGAPGHVGRAAPGHRQGNGQHAADLLVDTSKLSLDEIVKTVGYVPQDPGLLLFQDTLAQELTFTRNSDMPCRPIGGRPGAARQPGPGAFERSLPV